MGNWKDRDDQIIRLANRHVCRTSHFFRFFSSEKAAYRRVATLHEQGFLRLIGQVVLGGSGRPENIYCNGWRPKWDQLRHETLLTDFLLCYPTADIVRGWMVNRRIRPDAEMTLNGRFFYIELDTGEESYSQIQRRQRVYSGVEDYVLYVTLTERRLEGLRKHSRSIHKVVLFTTLDAALKDPCGVIWSDCFGEKAMI